MNSDSKIYSRCRLRAQEVARAAGARLLRAQRGAFRVHFKGAIDLVTEVDRKTEQFIGRELTRSFPDHDFLAEEAQRNTDTGAEFRWVVDPIDGTTNFAHRLPIYSVSIALEHKGEVVVGVVYQPALDEMFVGQRGWGARLNNKRISASKETRLERSLLVTGFPYDMHDSKVDNLEYFRRFMKKAQAVRRLGSAAIDLCYVACGRFDGFWEMKLSPWDIAAAALIATEAGARVTNMNGKPFSIYSGSILAAPPAMHAAMLQVLNGARVA